MSYITRRPSPRLAGVDILVNVQGDEPELSGDFAKLMKWADKYRTLKIRTNADTPADAERARQLLGAAVGR